MRSENIKIVLVGPQGSMNIGSIARAMKNMGLRELILMNPIASPMAPEARLMAVQAQDILEYARVFSTLEDAIADCTLVVGTTRRTGRGRDTAIDPRQMAAEINEISHQNKVAVLFGPEDRGLSNRDLDLCQRLVTIPAHEEFGSLNLAQAVMIICYEILMAANHIGMTPKIGRPAVSEELEGMYKHMEETLLGVGFLDKNNPKRVMAVLRRIFGRAQLNPREVKILRGICRQISWYRKH